MSKNNKKKKPKAVAAKQAKPRATPLTSSQVQQLTVALKQANSFLQQGHLNQAGALYQQVLQIDPNNLEALEQMGLAAYKTSQTPLAANCWRRVIDLSPKRVRSAYMLAMLLSEQGQLEEAISLYQRVLALDPRLIEAHNNLGVIYKNMERFEEAIECFDKVVKLQPRSAYALSNLGNVLKDAGYMDRAVEMLKSAIRADRELASAYSNLLVALNYLSDVPAETVSLMHSEWGAHVPDSIKPDRFNFALTPKPNGKIRVGLVSPDLHNHSVAYFVESLFKHHDRKRFEFWCYYNNRKHDSVSERLSSLVDAWKPVFELDEIELADTIFADEVDILIDLAGHTANNRLAVFFQKPAPVQITWLGYPNTTGLSQVDYRVCDELTDPPGIADALCSEAIIRLPEPFICYRPPESDAPGVQASPCLNNGYLTFGSFNNLVKMTPEVIQHWSALLKAVVGSKLLIKSRQLANEMTRERVLTSFAEQGIDTSRLVLHEMVPDLRGHLALYGEVDIALDTFPYNGTTTTCEALYMGVPVLGLRGECHASRVTYSLMTSIGLDSFVVSDLNAAIEKASFYNDQPEALQELRSGLRAKLLESKLCSGERFTDHFQDMVLEFAYKLKYH